MSMSFTGGDGMSSFLGRISRALGNDAVAKVGFLEGSMAGWSGPRPVSRGGKKGSTAKGGQAPAALVAATLEYGAPSRNIPPYPFFSVMITKHSPEWGSLIAACLKHQHYDARAALREVAIKVQEQLQEQIQETAYTGGDEEAHARTVEAKGGIDTPLRDSLNLLHSVDFVVVDGGE